MACWLGAMVADEQPSKHVLRLPLEKRAEFAFKAAVESRIANLHRTRRQGDGVDRAGQRKGNHPSPLCFHPDERYRLWTVQPKGAMKKAPRHSTIAMLSLIHGARPAHWSVNVEWLATHIQPSP
jgi:hypothetical protein